MGVFINKYRQNSKYQFNLNNSVVVKKMSKVTQTIPVVERAVIDRTVVP